MPGITFTAFEDDQPIGIGRVFALLPPRASALSWHVSRWFEAVPSPTTESLVGLIHDLVDREAGIPPDLLVELVSADLQVFDGELRASDEHADRLEFIIRSVRGDEWIVEARRTDELDQIAAQLPDWREIPHPIL